MTRHTKSSLLLAAVAALLVLAITAGSDLILERTRPLSFWPYLIDDFLMSALCAVVVWLYERQRLRELARKLYVISEMNHRVRNQLQVIEYAAYTAKEKQQVSIISESVSKIEAALNEILGGDKPKRRPPRMRGAED